MRCDVTVKIVSIEDDFVTLEITEDSKQLSYERILKVDDYLTIKNYVETGVEIVTKNR